MKLITTIAGEVTEMQIAFDGISDPDYVKKLAKRVKRGHDGVAREGRSPGALAYGYDAVLGKPGERLINPSSRIGGFLSSPFQINQWLRLKGLHYGG